MFCQHEIWNPLGKQLLSEGDSVQLVYTNPIWDIGKLRLLDTKFGRHRKSKMVGQLLLLIKFERDDSRSVKRLMIEW